MKHPQDPCALKGESGAGVAAHTRGAPTARHQKRFAAALGSEGPSNLKNDVRSRVSRSSKRGPSANIFEDLHNLYTTWRPPARGQGVHTRNRHLRSHCGFSWHFPVDFQLQHFPMDVREKCSVAFSKGLLLSLWIFTGRFQWHVTWTFPMDFHFREFWCGNPLPRPASTLGPQPIRRWRRRCRSASSRRAPAALHRSPRPRADVHIYIYIYIYICIRIYIYIYIYMHTHASHFIGPCVARCASRATHRAASTS